MLLVEKKVKLTVNTYILVKLLINFQKRCQLIKSVLLQVNSDTFFVFSP